MTKFFCGVAIGCILASWVFRLIERPPLVIWHSLAVGGVFALIAIAWSRT